MKQLNIGNTMRISKNFRRLIAATLAIIMALSITIPAFAFEYVTHIDPGCQFCNSGGGGGGYGKAARDAVAASASFSDVPSSHTFYTGIMWCAEHGIVGGYADGTFKPANTVTRANFVVMLTRAFYADEIDSSYVDPVEGSFAPNYLVAKRHRMLESTDFDYTTLRPERMNVGITRYNMAQLMNNVMAENGFSASLLEREVAAAKISDYDEIPGQYIDAVTNVYALGVIGGYADGSFSGNSAMNRGQGATVIYRMMQKMYPNGEIPTVDPEAPVDPVTSELHCACVDILGHPCEVCHTTSTGSGGTTTKPSTPGTPSNPSTGKTLVDGSAVTEANVMRLMEAKVAEWGDKLWGSATSLTKVYPAGETSDVAKVVNKYFAVGSGAQLVSCTGGCGGLATYLSDAAFGTTGFPLRKVTNPDDVRAGDIVLLLTDGKIRHIAVASGKDNVRTFSGVAYTNHGCYTANAGSKIGHSPNDICLDISSASFPYTTNYDSTTGASAVIYTRYPN